MFDYTNNFPLPELRPEGGLLRFQAYTQTPEFQAVWQGQSKILDKGRLNDPSAWGLATEQREKMIRDEYFASGQLLAAESGSNTGLYGEIIHESLGQDVNQGAVLRSIYFGADPLNAMQFAPSELPQTKEEEDYLAGTLSKLINDEIGKPIDQKNLTPTQQRIKEISDKLAYKKARDKAESNLGVSFPRQILAQSSWLSSVSDFLGFTSSDETGKLARNLDDIIRVRTRVDPTYSPTQWFNETFSDPIVQQGLLDNGISSDFIADTTNPDEAEYRIYKALNQTDLQRRMATYSPEWGDTARLLGSELVAGFVNSPDVVIDATEIVGGTALALTGAVTAPFTGGTSLVGTAAGAAQTITGTANLFLKLKNIWQGSKALRGGYYAAETVLKLPMGFAPSYAKNLGLLGRAVTPTVIGFSGSALTEYARQQNQMAYAAATLYADPDAVKELNMSMVAMAGVQGGITGGLLFGVAPNVISSLLGATKNKLLGVNYAKFGEPALRDVGDRRFSLKGTVIGEAIDSFGNLKIKREKSVAVDGPLQETMAAKAEIENKNPTGTDLIAKTEERVDRVETKNTESAEKAASIPDNPALKRYENETRAGYIERIAGLKQVSDIVQLARELGRRSVTASDNLKLTTDNWDQMVNEDKLKVLIDAEKQIKSLISFEAKTEGGLTSDRAKVISKMEVQRKALVKNLRKSLTKDQLKVFNKENKGGVALDTPTALKAVRAAKDAAAKREAASELAASLISKAQQIVKQPERAAEIRSTVPEELLNSFDEVTLEQNLKGTVSEETIEVVKANVAGLELPKRGLVSNFRKTIKDALTLSKIDDERMDKIRAVINNPANFADIVTGNKDNAQNFYNYLSQLKRGNLISETDMELVLAATAHLNFDSNAFNIKYTVDSLKNPDGSLIENVVGVYETKNKTLTMNLAWKPSLGETQAQQKRAMTVLHELGHAYFQNQAKGNIYKEVLKLYKNVVGLNADVVFTEAIYNIDDKLIANDFLDSYHLSNAEETFVETFSKILFTEAEFAVASLRPIQVSMAQNILKRITESVVLASKMWDSSKHYAAASSIIDSITKVDALLDDGVSVPKFVRGVAEILPNVIDRNDFNTRLAARLGTNKYSITDLEFEMVNRVSTSDPAILVAFSILKTEGKELKTQKDFDSLIDAYGLYKAAQMSSLMVRTSFGIQVHTSRLMKTKTREERLAWFEDHFFNSYLERMGVDPKGKSGISPPTYEDEYLLGLEVDGAEFPRETYGFNYWLTTGHSLLQFMDELGFDTTKGYAKSSITMSLLENLRQTYENYDLKELSKGLVEAAHRKFVAGLNNKGLFNIAEPEKLSENSVKDILTKIANSDESDTITKDDIAVAKDLLALVDKETLERVKVIRDETLAKNQAGTYSEATNFILLNPRHQKGRYTIHEIVHAAITDKVYKELNKANISWTKVGNLTYNDVYWGSTRLATFGETTTPAPKDLFEFNWEAMQENATPQMKAVSTIIQLYREACEKIARDLNKAPNFAINLWKKTETSFTKEEKQLYYGLTDVNEFIAESIANPKFRELLNKYTTGVSKTTIGSRLLKTFKTLLGFESNVKPETIFDSVIPQIEVLLQQDIDRSSFVNRVDTTDILPNVEPIRWGNAEVAMGAISDMLAAKTDLTTVLTVLQSQVDLNIIKTLSDMFDRVGDTPEEIANNLLTAVYNGIEKKLYVINETTGKLEQAATPKKTKKSRAKKPKEVKAVVVKAPEAPVKTPEESQIEAAADNSPEVTMDNFMDHLVKLAEEFSKDLNKEGVIKPAADRATLAITNLWSGGGKKIRAAIESGQINTVAKLRQALMTSGKNLEKTEIENRKRVKVTDPVTGEVRYEKRRVESLATAEGVEKTAKRVATAADPVVIKGLEKQNKQSFISNIRSLITTALPDFFTTKETELLNALVSAEFDEVEAAKLLDISDRTVNRRYNELKTRVHALFKEADIDLEMDRAAIVTSLQEWDTGNKAAAKAATTKKPTPAAIKKAEAAKPAKVDVKAEEKGNRILELAAKQAKLKTPNPDPVPVPKTTTEPTLTRTTAEVTGNAPEEIIRPESQADALAAGEINVVKESVVFTPKKPLTTEFANSIELESNPKKKQNLINIANRLGFDAIVFKDGSMLPLDKAKVEVVGKTIIDTPIGIETVVTVTKEKTVPVKKTEPKPKKPKAIGDGAPRTITKTGKPVDMKPEVRKSDIADETDAGRIERKMNEDREGLRASGLDTSSLKDFLSFYWSKMKDFDSGIGQPYTEKFKSAWAKFVVLNDEINQANINIVGEEGIKSFWQKVDELRANEAAKLATVPGYKRRTEAALFAEAGKSVNENFIPYITPKQLELKRIGENTYLSSKDKRIQAILRKNKEETDIPVPPEPTPTPEGVPTAPVTKLPEPETPDLEDRMAVLDSVSDNSEQAASMPLRQSSLIGVIFGGSNRESANWWRRFMNWSRNTLGQSANQSGRTVQSLQRRTRFIARFFSDDKAQTGHLAAAGKPAFRTAMQCANDEAMLIGRIGKYQSILNANLSKFDTARKQLMNILWIKLSKGEDIKTSDVSGLGGLPASMVDNVTRQANQLLTVVRQTNKVILDLEAETGLVKTVDEMGNPVDPQKWATVQLDHEKLSRLSPDERLELIDALVEARTNRKLANEVLDINTIIVMGWLDVRASAKHQGTALLAGDRRFKPSATNRTFSKETLEILDTGIVHSIGTDEDSILSALANKGQPDKFFVLEDGDVLRVYRLPEKISDLSETDKIKYYQAVNGDVNMYHPRWRTYINNQGARTLTELEMMQMLDFKTKRGFYSEYNAKTSTNIDRPLMKIMGDDEAVSLAVPGLIPDEVLQNSTIFAVMRTNLAESYYYFMKGRVFDLLFQRELDRLIGRKGITIFNVFEWLAVRGKQDIENLGRQLGWSASVIDTRLTELTLGISRLREEYAINADTLPYIPNKEQYAARASMALMKMKVSPGYIISAMPELVLEMLKHNPIKIPGNIIKLLREVAGDLRFSKNAQMMQDGATLAYHLENFRHEHGSRFLGEIAHGSFELDNKVRTKFIDSTNPIGMVDRSVRGLEVGARVAESIGSLQAMTNFVRGLGLHRWQARIWSHFKKGRIQKLMDAMEDPAMRDLMNKMLIASELSASEERKLWKQFAGKAREMGFGFEPQEAILFFQFNLNSKERIRHLEYLIQRVGDSNGLFNIDRMVDTYWNIRSNPVAGYDVKMFEEVISAYSNMLNTLVVRTTSPEPVGLGRITNIEARTSLGRLYYALTSWVRGYQDSVLLNYASENTLTYIVKNLLLFGTVDAIIGLFREWLAGREQEDILNEMEENPESFAIRVLKAAPIMGTANGILEAALSGINAYSGGAWRYYGSPMSSIGINAAGAAVKDITTGVSEFTGQLTAEDKEAAKMVSAIGKVVPFNSLFNRSAVAVPARFIEDMDYLDQKGAIQQYLNLIQREPYPYAKVKKAGGRSTIDTGVVPATPVTRNIAKEQAELARQEATRVQPSTALKSQIQSMVKDQKGVSGRLGELLE